MPRRCRGDSCCLASWRRHEPRSSQLRCVRAGGNGQARRNGRRGQGESQCGDNLDARGPRRCLHCPGCELRHHRLYGQRIGVWGLTPGGRIGVFAWPHPGDCRRRRTVYGQQFARHGLGLGVFCNALVCLAVWLCFSARSTSDKILAIMPPITAFVAMGFEHSIANMYFIPMGLLIRGDPIVMAVAGKSVEQLADLTWSGFLVNNLLPVTLGNIVGGGVMVAAVYWCVYLRHEPDHRFARMWRRWWLSGARGLSGETRQHQEPVETLPPSADSRI